MKRLVLLALLCVLFLLPAAPAAAQLAPQRTDVVESVAKLFPNDFYIADRHHPNGGGLVEGADRFVRRLAWVLHSTVDARFGLNGKCGTDHISFDAIAYRTSAIAGLTAQTFDVVGGAGGPNPFPAWIDVTDPRGCGAKWIAPTDPGGGPAVVEPKPQLPQDLTPILTKLTEISVRQESMKTVFDQLGSRVEKVEVSTTAAVTQLEERVTKVEVVTEQTRRDVKEAKGFLEKHWPKIAAGAVGILGGIFYKKPPADQPPSQK